MQLFSLVALILVALAFGGPRDAVADTRFIVLASTTSVENSGLLARVLPQFTRETGIDVHVVAVGTGQALDIARRGDADLVLVHDPEAEQQFIGGGDGRNRRQIAWNDFVIVGPVGDPAHIGGGHDAVAAFSAIAGAKAVFVSRGDRSGTNALELRLWKAAQIDPTKVGGGSWYRDIGGGMGQALNVASSMDAYTLSDRGTWLSFGNKGDLQVLVEGDPRLINRYDVIQLSPQKHASAKLADAAKLADWLVSKEGQQAIGAYAIDGQQLFHPSAAAPRAGKASRAALSLPPKRSRRSAASPGKRRV
jgi:tungstate transport system substrate-binding protein